MRMPTFILHLSLNIYVSEYIYIVCVCVNLSFRWYETMGLKNLPWWWRGTKSHYTNYFLPHGTPLRKSIPWPPNIRGTCLLYRACHAKCIFADPLQMFHACHRFWKCHNTLTCCSLLAGCTIPCACHAKRHLNVQKCSVPVSVLHFWLQNVLRVTTACTFSTSQLPKVLRNHQFFNTFDFEMCCAPQRHALFRHLNFQKSSEHEVLCTFWLRKSLRATPARNFSSLIWPNGSAPAALASLLFDPPEPQIIGKTQWISTFLPFRTPASSFFWLFLFSDLLSSSLFFSSLLWLFRPLLFHLHIVGSLTSKLPSKIERGREKKKKVISIYLSICLSIYLSS